MATGLGGEVCAAPDMCKSCACCLPPALCLLGGRGMVRFCLQSPTHRRALHTTSPKKGVASTLQTLDTILPQTPSHGLLRPYLCSASLSNITTFPPPFTFTHPPSPTLCRTHPLMRPLPLHEVRRIAVVVFLPTHALHVTLPGPISHPLLRPCSHPLHHNAGGGPRY